MLLFLAGFLVGGLAGAVMLALIVAADEQRWHRSESNTRTANRARETGSTWVIAGNGAVTTGSRLGRFSVARRKMALRL